METTTQLAFCYLQLLYWCVSDHCYNCLVSDPSDTADLEYMFLLYYSFYPLKGITMSYCRGMPFVSFEWFEWFLLCSFGSHLSAQYQHGTHSALLYMSPYCLSEMRPWFFLALSDLLRTKKQLIPRVTWGQRQDWVKHESPMAFVQSQRERAWQLWVRPWHVLSMCPSSVSCMYSWFCSSRQNET